MFSFVMILRLTALAYILEFVIILCKKDSRKETIVYFLKIKDD